MPQPTPTPHDDTAVRLSDARCRRGRREVLDGITLDIERGRVTGVLGPNGAGKSTLLGIVTGLRPLTGGEAWVLGERLPSGPRLRRRLGVVLQDTALYDELTTRHNLRFAAALYRVPDADRRIAEVLELLGLSDRARQVVGTLSGGLRRRVAIARSLLHDPELLIVDEPTLGVDAEARHAIWAHIRLLRSRGTTVLVASNHLDEVLALCDSAAVLRDGRLLARESPQALVARAGQCIDIDCDPATADAVVAAVGTLPGVTRTETTPSGTSVFVTGEATPEDVVHRLLQRVSIGGFRVRAADLAEVFRVLEPAEACG
ncbi:MAG TPA: ABC transporter ATP-binding protein [Candidatus Dormibacteraeota bacterium]|nr:ABC transporter ATP-binding protein [Candidatus Dormibacteraeota bacterium]